MRWIVTLIAAVCVATAGSGRIDELRTRDHHAATLAPAPATLATATQRRDNERRDLSFVAAASPEIAAPSPTSTDAPQRCASSVASVDAPAPCSRGPPRG